VVGDGRGRAVGCIRSDRVRAPLASRAYVRPRRPPIARAVAAVIEGPSVETLTAAANWGLLVCAVLAVVLVVVVVVGFVRDAWRRDV
jgi:hypothetical protein